MVATASRKIQLNTKRTENYLLIQTDEKKSTC
jgi:hypothetical protein